MGNDPAGRLTTPGKHALRLAAVFWALATIWTATSGHVTSLHELAGLSSATAQAIYALLYVALTATITYGYIAALLPNTQLRAEAHFQDLYENAPDMYASVDASTGTVIQCNQTMAKFTGFDKSGIIGRHILTLYHPDSLDAARKAFHSFVTTGQVRDAELQILKSDGGKLDVSLNVSAVRDEHGKVLYSRSVWRDITERKRAEEKVRRSEALLRDLVDGLGPNLFVGLMTTDGVVIDANQPALKAAGLTREDVIGKPVEETYWFSYAAPVQQQLRECVERAAAGEPSRYDVKIRVSPTDFAWIDLSFQPMRDEMDEVVYIVPSAAVITDRKLAEEALQHERDFTEAMLDGLPGVLYCYDQNFRFLRWNDNFERVTGYSGEEIAKMSPLDFFAPGDKELLAARIGEVFDKGASDVEADFLSKDGGRTPFYFTGLRAEIQGRPHLVGVGIDIKERKRAEIALREREELFRLFVEHSPAAIAMFDTSMKYVIASRRWSSDYGLGERAITGQSHYEVFPDVPDRWKEIHRRCLGGAVERCEEDAFVRADGHTDWVRWEARPWRQVDGEIGGIIIFSEVVTDRKLAEIERQRSEARLSFALQQSHTGGWELDLVEHTAHRTLEHDRIFGYESLLPRWTYEMFLEHILPEDRAEVDRRFREATATQSDWSFECRILRRDGEIRWIWAAGGHQLDTAGRAKTLSGVVQDITERKRAESALIESERRYRALFENMTAGFELFEVVQDDKGVPVDLIIIAANREFEKTTGLKIQDVTGKRLTQVLPGIEDDAANWIETFGKVALTGESRQFEQGSERLGYFYSITAYQAAPNQCAVAFLDITERKRLEAEREKFVMLAESSSDFIGMCDLELQPIYVNPAGIRMVGLPDMAAACGVKVQDYFFPEDQAFIEEEFFPRVLREGHGDVEIRLRHFQTGAPIWMFYYLFSVHDAGGTPIGWATVSRDITERKQAEKALRESEERLRLALDAAHMGIFDWDLEWSRITWSRWHEEMWGYQPGEFDGTYDAFARRVHPEDLPGVNTEVERCMADHDPFVREFRVLWPDGSERWVVASGEFTYDTTGRATRMLGAVLEITERKRSEEAARLHQQQLMRADKMASLGVLVSGVAHEINNPNTFVATNSAVFRDVWNEIQPVLDRYYRENGDFAVAGWEYTQLKERVPALLNGIAEGSDRITRIVHELREFARDMPDASTELVRLNDVVESSVMLMRNMLYRATSKFEKQLADGLPLINGSRQRLEQVVINLLQNACQALTSSEQRITVNTFYDESAGMVVLAVSDEGIGIDQKTIGRIMDPFFTTRGANGGTGLGLAICDKIMKEHDGQITFASVPAEGTSVTISLPPVGTD